MIDIQLRIHVNGFTEFRQTAGQQAVVITHADNVVACAVAEADVPVVHHVHSPTILLVAVVFHSTVRKVWLHDTLQVFRRTIVHNDELPVLVGLGNHALDGLVEEACLVGGYGDRECHFCGFSLQRYDFFSLWLQK